MARQYRFNLSARFVVRWTHSGELKVVAAPFLQGDNPYLFTAGGRILSAIEAADRTSGAFLSRVGKAFRKEYMALPPEKREAVVFPDIPFSVKVAGSVDVQARLILKGEGVARGTVGNLKGKSHEVEVRVSYSGLTAQLFPPVAIAKTDLCFTGDWEINGHPDPNCRWSWGSCGCKATPCCNHIVQDAAGNCWTEKCAWGWLWLACGCHRDRKVPCPDCH
jgi:hypothetical protein